MLASRWRHTGNKNRTATQTKKWSAFDHLSIARLLAWLSLQINPHPFFWFPHSYIFASSFLF
ncbi:hypothetical protein TWF173_011545 [Orbilia oligospora]|nr:hypothetical protein TWF173_011545 [Orbilia oligospora]